MSDEELNNVGVASDGPNKSARMSNHEQSDAFVTAIIPICKRTEVRQIRGKLVSQARDADQFLA